MENRQRNFLAENSWSRTEPASRGAVPMGLLMSATPARAQVEVSSKGLCSVYNRSSPCTYYNSEHASGCLEIHFPSLLLLSETHDLATLPKLLLVLLPGEHESRTVHTSEWPWLHAPCCPVESMLADSMGFRGFASMLSCEIGVLDGMVFTCWSSKLVDGNESKLTNSTSRLSASGCASRIYSSAASRALRELESNFLCHICLCFYPAVCARGHCDRQHINSTLPFLFLVVMTFFFFWNGISYLISYGM